MSLLLRQRLAFTLVLAMVSQGTALAEEAVLKGTYLFDNALTAQEPTAPAIGSVDPLALNGFESATVFSQADGVYHLDGNVSPFEEQAGLSLSTAGLIPVQLFRRDRLRVHGGDFQLAQNSGCS